MSPSLKSTLVAFLLIARAGAVDPTPVAPETPTLTIEKLVAFVPPDAKLKNGGKWQPVGTARATEAMRSKGLQQQAEFKIKVAVLEPHPYNGHSICIHSKPVPVAINGTNIPYVVFVFFDTDGLAGLGKTRVGDTVTVTGILNKADIEIRGDSATLPCEILRAQIKPPSSKP